MHIYAIFSCIPIDIDAYDKNHLMADGFLYILKAKISNIPILFPNDPLSPWRLMLPMDSPLLKKNPMYLKFIHKTHPH
jgi:hypothetical protein